MPDKDKSHSLFRAFKVHLETLTNVDEKRAFWFQMLNDCEQVFGIACMWEDSFWSDFYGLAAAQLAQITPTDPQRQFLESIVKRFYELKTAQEKIVHLKLARLNIKKFGHFWLTEDFSDSPEMLGLQFDWKHHLEWCERELEYWESVAQVEREAAEINHLATPTPLKADSRPTASSEPSAEEKSKARQNQMKASQIALTMYALLMAAENPKRFSKSKMAKLISAITGIHEKTIKIKLEEAEGGTLFEDKDFVVETLEKAGFPKVANQVRKIFSDLE